MSYQQFKSSQDFLKRTRTIYTWFDNQSQKLKHTVVGIPMPVGFYRFLMFPGLYTGDIQEEPGVNGKS
jgi:hypothetical protein